MSNDNVKNPNEVGGLASLKSPFYSPDDVVKQEVYTKFLQYMALPDPDKCDYLGIPFIKAENRYAESPTLKRFSEMHGVSQNTLTTWKKRSDFQAAVVAYRKEWGRDRTNNVMAALYRNCMTRGNAYDIELWLAYMENWDRKQVIKVVQEKFDADDLRAIIGRLPEEEQDKYYVLIGEIITASELAGGKRQVSQDSTSESGSDTPEV